MDEKDSRDKQEKGWCWVCGAETKNRCGACEAAGSDLFFCSKEHQKLVWFNHKRVCGSASNPFHWPSFNDDEIQLFHEVADKRRPQGEDEDLSLSSALSFFLKLPKDQVTQRASLLLKDPSLIDPRMRYEALILARIIGNLTSNGAKFTKAGGKLTIKTELIYPLQENYDTPQHLPTAAELVNGVDSSLSSAETDATYSPRLSAGRLQALEAKTSPQPKEMLVVRFEVTDTGVGIRKSDMAENRLFSPYVQTAVGREQGGKGTGLGLSLVRQIVMLSGGRLGVRSKVGEGSTFFIELPFAIGPVTREAGEEFSHSHRRSEATIGGMTLVDKEKDGSISPITPGTDSSTASDYRFAASLRKRSSDALDSINEDENAQGRPRDSSVSTQLSVPANYRFSPPVSPALSNEPTSPPLFVTRPTPPNSASPLNPPSTSSSASSAAASPPSSSPPAFSHPFALVPPSRPENRSHVSSASAPAEVTIPPHMASSPVVSPSPTSSAAAKPLGTPAAGGSGTALELADGPLRVLVVDDDTLTRKLMSRMMQRLGCIVSTAENGKIALDMLLAPPPEGYGEDADADEDDNATVETVRGQRDDIDAAEKGMVQASSMPKRKRKVGMDPRAGIDAYKHYDITFLDNQMPICSGVQVVAKLRSLGRDDLVVGVTANALLSDQEQYLESGASFILTKPVKEADLRKYLLVADKRRSESKDPALRRQRQAMSILAGPSFPPPLSIHGAEDDEY